jgi:hypothetical protein
MGGGEGREGGEGEGEGGEGRERGTGGMSRTESRRIEVCTSVAVK